MQGLSDALVDAGAASSSGRQLSQLGQRQPWAAAAVRPATASASDTPGAAAPGTFEVAPGRRLEPRLEEASQSSTSSRSTTGAEAEAAAAALHARPPPGHTDFQQRQLVMLFTCTKCNTRAAKAFSKQSYEQGVVIVECPGCHNKHLIADNLGWFGQKGTVEEFAAARGSTVVHRTADGTVELSPEDLLGPSLAAAAAAAEAGGSGTQAAAADAAGTGGTS
ncbi:hypothetical protein CHLNCDRAFT_134348 [Chlorella variabilis]|uniref:DNL-type domain-containing protein n=1 Tax=Chlorella variabilis TaxID=554065 RepID=E1ZFT9_CHLVA|nr:hypothetical protein CHLNCDRAFT_134348 [Chlorella variabilis]EFN55185.1 hypothetical protein CHLNCDRAFT_134348 [Chlorella variabilis]|eukprot:XP_005847287.1 hypothetical protein CHLNCDRAFT_134348 [Chlorella variabilis]